MSDTDTPLEGPTTAPRTEPAVLAPATVVTSTVQIKLPPYWPSDPQIWFAQFNTRRITSQKTRFDYVISSLAPEVAHEVRDLLLRPPENNQYDALKSALIQRTTLSEQRRLQQLFSAEELGDRKPSQLLRRVQQLLGDKASTTDSSFLLELFLQRLPPHVCMVLASTDTTDLEKLAQLADKIVEVAAPRVNTTTSQSSNTEINTTTTVSQSSNPEIQQLRAEISELKQLIQEATSRPQRRHRSSSRPSRSQPSRPTSPDNSTSDNLCWYHHRFGDLARKCQPPCSRSQENAQASH